MSLNLYRDSQVGKSVLDQLITHFRTVNYSEGYFLYLKGSDSKDPYDLIPLIQCTD